MADLQVKHVPDTLHQRLRRYAQGHKCTLSDIVLSAIEHELARREWHERLAERPVMTWGTRRRRYSQRSDRSVGTSSRDTLRD